VRRVNGTFDGYARPVESGPVACSYELVKDGVVVATGQLTLPRLPEVGESIGLGAASAEVIALLPGPRLRLRR
jgi:hypothetical protein